VKDTAFERKQHESTAKHQNNLKRFLRDIQNGHERSEREKQRAKAEVDRLKGTFGSPSSDPSTNLTSTAQAVSVSSKRSAPVPQSAADQKRQWAQLADMGIKVPEHVRSEMAMAGDWAVVSNQPSIENQPEQSLSIGVKKRKFEGQDEEEEEVREGEGSVARRRWGTTTKRFPRHDDADLDDLLSGSISMMKREEIKASPSSFAAGSPGGGLEAPDKNKVADKAAAGDQDSMSANLDEGKSCRLVKNEDDDLANERTCRGQGGGPVEQIPTDPPIPLFKRRKAKVS